MRLFQALLAGAHPGYRGSEWTEAKAESFRWLEEREPPVIVTPAARLAPGYTLYVPNNDSDRTFKRQDRLTSKMAQPHRLCDGDTLHYLWSIEESDESGLRHAELLCYEARHLLALGWGVDQVVGNGRILNEAQAAALAGRRWRTRVAQGAGQQRWRLPSKGSLRDIEEVHHSFLQRVKGKQYRPQLKLSVYQTVTYSASVLPPRSHAIFELPEGVAFRQEAAATVAAMLRSLTCRLANDDTHRFPGGSETYVAGHTGKQDRTPPRFSYLPLPTIGHEHADGMIRRLLIAEPFGGDGLHAHWAQNRLRIATLTDKDGNDRGVLLDTWRPSTNLMVRRYVGEARTWCTVTPVILPGFDDGKHAKAERLFLTAMQQAELPFDTIAELTLRKAPFWPNSQHPSRYSAPVYLKHLARWHVRIVFHEPVSGPLAIGAGRHSGLGTLAASEERNQ